MFDQFYNQVLATSFLEGVAAICGIISVYFSYKENLLVYPFGIVSVLIYTYLCALPSVKLYADAGVNFYYFLMSIYGWYYWSKGNSKNKTPIGSQDFKQKIKTLFSGMFVFFVLSLILKNFTDSDIPIWDALSTSLAIIGMYLMARKKIEHWYYWIVCDFISIAIYLYKGLIFTSFQYLVFTVFALLGVFAWRKKLALLQAVYHEHN